MGFCNRKNNESNRGHKSMAAWMHCMNPKCCYFIITTLIFLFVLEGCSKRNILDENKFMKVYVDLVIAQDTSGVPIAKFDSVKSVIFKRDGITKDEYSATINHYNKDPKKWQEFFNKTTAYIEGLRSKSQPQTSPQKK